MDRAHNMVGAAWMTASMAGYVINDSLIKLAAEELPLFQAIFLRGIAVTLFVWGLCAQQRVTSNILSHFRGPVLVRIATEMGGTVVYLVALTHVPIASLTAIMQIVPLAVTVAAARLLREQVSPARWFAVGVGLVGVALIVRPGSDSFSPWLLLGASAAALIVGRELATRRVGASVPSLVISLGTAVAITAMGGAYSIVDGWESLEIRELAILAGAAFFLAIGYVCSVITIRTGEMSFTAPFRYSVLVFAIVLQIVVFDDFPDLLTIIGSLIIVASGTWAFANERRHPAAAAI